MVVHAIMDALLGAAALKDIGYHFPDTDPEYGGVSSMKLLDRVREMLEEKLYLIENIDATIIAQKPKLRPYLEQMEANVAGVLRIGKEQVNIKATTEEGLGFTGAMEGNRRPGGLCPGSGSGLPSGRPERDCLRRLPGM